MTLNFDQQLWLSSLLLFYCCCYTVAGLKKKNLILHTPQEAKGIHILESVLVVLSVFCPFRLLVFVVSLLLLLWWWWWWLYFCFVYVFNQSPAEKSSGKTRTVRMKKQIRKWEPTGDPTQNLGHSQQWPKSVSTRTCRAIRYVASH